MTSSSRWRAGRVGAVAALATTLSISIPAATAANPGPAAPPPAALSAPAARTTRGSPPAPDGDRLPGDLRAAARASGAGFDAAAGHVSEDPSGRVKVLLTVTDGAAASRAVSAAGGEVRATTTTQLVAVVPRARLGALSRDPSIVAVANGRQYHNDAGTVTSEGVAAAGATPWLAAGRDGSGVNVAVIDVGGFQGYANELGDELPSFVSTKNFCGPNPDVIDSSFTEDPHGTEVAAIVHDMAPGAGLTLICAQNDPEIVQAQNYILARNSDGDSSNDITIVNASWGGQLNGRGDGSGGPNTAEGVVRTLRQHGVLWVGSSGNEGDVHDRFVPAGPDAPTGYGPVVAWAKDNYEDGFVVPPFSAVDVAVKWDAWTGPPQDFDVYLIDGVGNEVGFRSTNRQVFGAPPVEDAFVVNSTGFAVVYYAIITRFSATANPRFDTYVLYADSELVDPAGSISLPADSPDAFAVGATCYASGGLEPFSGRGPTIDGRRKPDLTGPDGTSQQDSTSTTSYGPANGACTSGFIGTSASAPHVAGAAALVKQLDPALTVLQIEDYLERRATDIGSPGPDNDSGFGRLDLGSLGSAPAAGDPTGTLDRPTPFPGGVAVSGIAFDPDSAVPSSVTVSVDGGVSTEVAAALARPDAPQAFAGLDGPFHGYAATFALPPGNHQVCVTARNAPTTAGSDVAIGCATVTTLAGGASRTRDVDFNGDGAADIAVMRPGSPASLWFSASLPQVTAWGDSGHGDIAVPADYNGDGRAEPAVFRPTSPAQWWIAGRSGPVLFGQPGDIPVVGDYNGDGRADIAVWRPGSPGQLWVDGLPNQPLLWGSSSLGDLPVPADYNGDGVTDFAVFRPSSPGQWWIVGLAGPVLFGETGDVPVAADYTGDGVADIAVLRLTGIAEQWYVNGLGAGLFGASTFGDIPLPADYNGDRRADIAVLRPGAPDRWFLNAIGSVAFGQGADVPVSGR